MSKAATFSDMGLTKKGDAAPPTDATGRVEMLAAQDEQREERKEGGKEGRREGGKVDVDRRRPWDGQDDAVKASYEVPRRIQTKLHTLKTWGRVKNIKGFVSEALEAALDKEIAKAEREGY